jgi:hypothetical protein
MTRRKGKRPSPLTLGATSAASDYTAK